MPNPRGRPRKQTLAVGLRLPYTLISAIKTNHPELLKRDGSNEFAHGKFSGYIESILWRQVRGTQTPTPRQLTGRCPECGRIDGTEHRESCKRSPEA